VVKFPGACPGRKGPGLALWLIPFIILMLNWDN
jgi:hypothetical protein